MHLMDRRGVAAAAAVALLAGGGAAYAAGGSHAAARSHGRGAVLSAIASYLGLSAQQLRADLAAGQTLAQIAHTQGKSVSGLEQTIESQVKSRLDQAVSAGKITAQREQQILNRLQSRLDRLVNEVHPELYFRHGRLRRMLLRISAGYLGLTAQQLKAELQAGKTLAQIASEQGKTVSGLEQAITSAVKARLDKDVAAGRISPEREQQILARLQSTLDTFVNHSFSKP